MSSSSLNYQLKLNAIEYTKDLIEAKMSNSTIAMNEENGKQVAQFMHEIYNGFLELYTDACALED